MKRIMGALIGCKNSVLLVAMMLWASVALAQPVTITYPTGAQNITRAISSSKLTVKLVFNGACSGTTTVKVALPASVSYVASSISKTGGTAAMAIAESVITDLRNPVFAVTGIAASGDNITFTLYREADCGSLTSAKDSIFVVTSGGCSSSSDIAGTVNTYNIQAPSLSITPSASITNAVIDTTLNRLSTITNGGNGNNSFSIDSYGNLNLAPSSTLLIICLLPSELLIK